MPVSCAVSTFDDMPWTALLVAACSAAGFALSTSLQHLAAGQAPEATQGTHRLLAHLAGRPWWVIGQLVAVVSFALHALALRLGALVVVQPVVVSGIAAAVPVRAALARRLPSRSELGTVTLTAAGLPSSWSRRDLRPATRRPATG
jgi:RsiW-degrading membrane proteinase PrsW (M82 family)